MTVKPCNKVQEIDFPSTEQKRSGWKIVQIQQTWKSSLQNEGNTDVQTDKPIWDRPNGSMLSKFSNY